MAHVTLRVLLNVKILQSDLHNKPIGFHELIYPLLQGYDSVALKADVELGGTDQTFNLLMGRFLQEHMAKNPKLSLPYHYLKALMA